MHYKIHNFLRFELVPCILIGLIIMFVFIGVNYEMGIHKNGTVNEQCKLDCTSWGKVDYTCIKDCLDIKAKEKQNEDKIRNSKKI